MSAESNRSHDFHILANSICQEGLQKGVQGMMSSRILSQKRVYNSIFSIEEERLLKKGFEIPLESDRGWSWIPKGKDLAHPAVTRHRRCCCCWWSCRRRRRTSCCCCSCPARPSCCPSCCSPPHLVRGGGGRGRWILTCTGQHHRHPYHPHQLGHPHHDQILWIHSHHSPHQQSTIDYYSHRVLTSCQSLTEQGLEHLSRSSFPSRPTFFLLSLNSSTLLHISTFSLIFLFDPSPVLKFPKVLKAIASQFPLSTNFSLSFLLFALQSSNSSTRFTFPLLFSSLYLRPGPQSQHIKFIWTSLVLAKYCKLTELLSRVKQNPFYLDNHSCYPSPCDDHFIFPCLFLESQ